jgi:hypothetical protein
VHLLGSSFRKRCSFLKKEPKNFTPFAGRPGAGAKGKSLFASFSSEKEESYTNRLNA